MATCDCCDHDVSFMSCEVAGRWYEDETHIVDFSWRRDVWEDSCWDWMLGSMYGLFVQVGLDD